MKRGCFFAGIVFLTISVGVGFYLYKKYFPELKSFGKEKIMQLSLEDMNKKIDAIPVSVYKDSIKILMIEQSEILKEKDFDEAMTAFSSMIDQINIFLKDDSIDSVEYTTLKNMAIIK